MTWQELHHLLIATLADMSQEQHPEWTDLSAHWDTWDDAFLQADEEATAPLRPAIAALAAGKPLPPLAPPLRLMLYWRLAAAESWVEALLHFPWPLPPAPSRRRAIHWLLGPCWAAAGSTSIHETIESLLRALPPSRAGRN